MNPIVFNASVPFLKKEKCLKKSKILGSKGKCCCNCMFHVRICGHPWVTGTATMTPTGLFACAAPMLTGGGKPDDQRNADASDGHGMCEMWEEFKPDGRWEYKV